MERRNLFTIFYLLAMMSGLFPGSAYADDMGQALADFQAGHYREAYRLWLPLAKQGNARAQYNLGLLYRNGRGVEQNDRQALIWFSRAAEQGLLDAQYNTGLMYMEGRGVATSKIDALNWWQLAASKGHAAAEFNLGVMYAYGSATGVDTAKALDLWRRSAAQGYKQAREALYRVYTEGLFGVKPDPEKAKQWQD